MSNKTLLLIIGTVLGVSLLLIFIFFEIKQVPDVKWNKSYAFTSKEPFGGWVFVEALKKKYNEEHIQYHYEDVQIKNIDTSGYLYIYLGWEADFTSRQSREFLHFLDQGNEALFITHDLYINVDSTLYTVLYTDTFRDSILDIKSIEKDRTYSFSHYQFDFDSLMPYHFSVLYESDFADILPYTPLLTWQDSMTIFARTQVDSMDIYWHTVPYLFTNMSSVQSDYLSHFHDVISRFDSDQVILDHHSFSTAYRKEHAENPIQYLLSNRSLRWAYYLSILGMLLFIYFRGKRKQRPIPTVEKNKNTSLEFVHTLSQLHLSQNQNHKLVQQFSTIFYHRIKNKYYVEPTDPDFVAKVAKKSRINERDIQVIIDRFNSAHNNYEYNDLQLIHLHKRIDTFFKNCE